jgi:hypothetical protein
MSQYWPAQDGARRQALTGYDQQRPDQAPGSSEQFQRQYHQPLHGSDYQPSQAVGGYARLPPPPPRSPSREGGLTPLSSNAIFPSRSQIPPVPNPTQRGRILESSVFAPSEPSFDDRVFQQSYRKVKANSQNSYVTPKTSRASNNTSSSNSPYKPEVNKYTGEHARTKEVSKTLKKNSLTPTQYSNVAVSQLMNPSVRKVIPINHQGAVYEKIGKYTERFPGSDSTF